MAAFPFSSQREALPYSSQLGSVPSWRHLYWNVICVTLKARRGALVGNFRKRQDDSRRSARAPPQSVFLHVSVASPRVVMALFLDPSVHIPQELTLHPLIPMMGEI